MIIKVLVITHNTSNTGAPKTCLTLLQSFKLKVNTLSIDTVSLDSGYGLGEKFTLFSENFFPIDKYSREADYSLKNKFFAKLKKNTILSEYEMNKLIIENQPYDFVHYKSSFVDELKTKYGIKIYQSTINDTRIKSWIRTKIKGTLDLKLLLLQLKPDLVVINEGAVFSAYKEMNFCKQLNIPYTVTNGLVADIHWLNLTDVFYDQFLRLYRGARKLIFVSEHNKNQFAEMLEPMGNQMVVKNPVSYNYLSDLSFPNHHLYTIAFVGRFEFYHKGLDLLLSALKDKRWLDRNIKFNFYGDGPHKEILINKVEQYALTFCEVFDSNFDFGDIWSKNQIAIHTSRFEGKSLSITEAMYNKRAIIMTDVGGVSELIKDGINGFVSKSITKEGILSTLERAWEKRDDWQSMGILSREIYDALDKGPTLTEIIVL